MSPNRRSATVRGPGTMYTGTSATRVHTSQTTVTTTSAAASGTMWPSAGDTEDSHGLRPWSTCVAPGSDSSRCFDGACSNRLLHRKGVSYLVRVVQKLPRHLKRLFPWTRQIYADLVNHPARPR